MNIDDSEENLYYGYSFVKNAQIMNLETLRWDYLMSFLKILIQIVNKVQESMREKIRKL